MSWKERTEISKNIIDVLKGVFIIFIIIVLLFRYDWVNDLFDKYNVAQLEFGGIKVDRSEAAKRLKESADKLPQLQAQITEAKRQFDDLFGQYTEATSALTELQKQHDAVVEKLRTVTSAPTTGPQPALPQPMPVAVNDKVQRVLSLEGQIATNFRAAQTNLGNAAATTQSALANLPAADTSGSAQNAVIFGSYQTAAPAQKAVADAQQKGFPGGVIFLRQGFYRAALQFPAKAEADAKLPQAITALSGQAYVVDLRSWCPKPIRESGLLNCGF